MTEITDIGTHPGFFCLTQTLYCHKEYVNLLILGVEMLPGYSSLTSIYSFINASMIVIIK